MRKIEYDTICFSHNGEYFDVYYKKDNAGPNKNGEISVYCPYLDAYKLVKEKTLLVYDCEFTEEQVCRQFDIYDYEKTDEEILSQDDHFDFCFIWNGKYNHEGKKLYILDSIVAV